MTLPLTGADHEQLVLLPPSADEYVDHDSDVRLVKAFVDFYDPAAKGFKESSQDKNGRPSYPAKYLLGLFIYGYLKHICSSRRLDAEVRVNLELIWLLRGLKPDNRTIARFRHDNAKCFPDAFRAFTRLCSDLQMLGNKTVAIDGAKLSAVNNKKRHIKISNLKKKISQYEKDGAEYQALMDAIDAEEAREPTPDDPNEIRDAVAIIEARTKQEQEREAERVKAEQKQREVEHLKELKHLREMARLKEQERLEKLENAKQQKQSLEESGIEERALTDSDAVLLTDNKHLGGVVGYNTQIAVDAKNHMVLAFDVVTDKNDLNQLGSMALQAKAAIEGFECKKAQDAEEESAALQVLADAGYHQVDQLEICEKSGIKTYVPESIRRTGVAPNGATVFGAEQFIYDVARDVYVCPADQELKPTKRITKVYGTPKRLYANRKACSGCPLHAQCTTGKMRMIKRRINQGVGDRAAERMQADPEVFRQRKSLVEHVFGSLRRTGHDCLLTRGKTNVKAELSLSFMTYNMRRAINVMGVAQLITALSAANIG